MNIKRGALLVIPLLAILFGGCASNPSPMTLDLCRPPFPNFSHDSSPDPPNYYWMDESPIASDKSD